MLLGDFLQRILPVEGYKCWVEINQRKKVTQGFVATHDELARKLLEIDARGSDAYFACATYRTTDNRRQVNALCAQALWLDIDTKETKANAPYNTVEDAVQACDDFCNQLDIPLPGIVRSGGGIHAYWPFTAPLDANTWTRVATRFKQLTTPDKGTPGSGLYADATRTADIASILRPPGTGNHKKADRPLRVAVDGTDGFEPIDPVAFIEHILQHPANSRRPTPATPPLLVSNDLLLAGISKAFDPAKGVAQGSRGSTQLRYAGELVAKGYPEAEVIRLCREWNQRCDPPQDDKEVLRVVASAFNMHARKHPPVIPVEEAHTLPALPHGYQWGPQQQLLVKIKEMQDDGSEVERLKVVSPYPVYMAAILNHEHGSRHNSYLFRQYSLIDGWNEFCVNSESINAQNWYAGWFSHGGSIHKGMEKYFLTYVREAEIMLRADKEVTRYNQFGWKENYNAFLVGDVLMRGGVPQRAYGTDKLTPLMQTMVLPKEGSLEEWTAAADKFFAPGMEAHGFALLTSFAAPLMPFVAGIGDGGSILSLVSEESGKGKTPVSEAIASVWGDLDACRVTGNFTANRLIAEVVRRCHLPQVEEEMTIADPAVAAENVKKFTTGTDRARLDRGGTGKEIPEHYQTIMLSISNTSLHDMVKQVDRAAARRIFELDMERPDNIAFSNLGSITREMMRCRAFAGRRWAQIITSPGLADYFKEHLTGLSQESPGGVVLRYRSILQSEAEHRFIVWLLSTVDIAARLLVYYGILHFDVDRIMTWAARMAAERTGERGGDSSSAKLQRFLSEHIGSCLVVSGPFEREKGPCVAHVEPRYQLIMRMELKTQKLYISSDALQKWCVRNRVSLLKFGNDLERQRVVTARSRPTTLGAGTMIPSSRCYCWEIDMSHGSMSGSLKEVTDIVAEAKEA